MAKKRKSNNKKHGDSSSQGEGSEFMSGLNEKEDHQQEQSMEEETYQQISPEQEKRFDGDERIMSESADSIDPDHQRNHEENHKEEIEETQTFSEEYPESIENEDESSEGEFSIGVLLKNTREEQGISLKNVSQSTKISLTNLEYLESENLSKLPDRAYVIGYVKSYAKLLGLDSNLAVELLERTYQLRGQKTVEPQIVIPQATNSPQVSAPINIPKFVTIGGACLLIAGLAAFFFLQEDSGKPEREETVAENYEREIEAEQKSEEEITPQTLNAETPLQSEIEVEMEDEANDEADAETQESTAQVVAEVKEVVAAEKKEEVKKEVKKEEKKEEVKEEKKEEEKRKFYPLSDSLYSFDDSISEEKINELLPSNFKVNPTEGVQAVYITAVKGDSWLTYKSDSDPIKKFVLKEGRSLLFRAKEARVFLGNLGAVKIFLNNQPLKISSRTGVKSLVFPQTSSDKYMMPLFIYKEDGTVETSEDYIKRNQ